MEWKGWNITSCSFMVIVSFSQDLPDVPGNHGSMLWGYQKGSNSNGLRLPQQASTWSPLAQHCNYRGAHLRAVDSYNVINTYLAGKSKQ